MIDFETSVRQWKKNRGKINLKGYFYKEGVLGSARERFLNGDSELTSLCRNLEENYGHLIDTDKAYLIKMIEDTTPGPCHMNLSPEHDFGVPHGLWNWDPKNPDVIIDEVTKTTFPNEKYPETGVLETYWGKPQRFTYYTGKSILYNKYTMFASFSGKVRYYKVLYMTEAAYNLAFLYHLTGNFDYAKKSADILLRFAEVYPYWLAHGMYGDIADMDPKLVGLDPFNLPYPRTCLPPNEPVHELHVGYWGLGRATASGQEGGGFLLPVCITYSMIADLKSDEGVALLTEEQKQKIEQDILLEGISLVVNDTRLNNKSCSNRFAAMAVGMLTGVEEYIDYGKEGFYKIVEQWYLKDGSTSESASYSMMVMNSMWIAAELLEGYRGINGKEDPIKVYGWNKYHAVWKAMYDTLNQDLKYPASADSRLNSQLSTLFVKILAYRFKKTEYKALLLNSTDIDSKRRSIYHVISDNKEKQENDKLLFRDNFFPDFRQGYLRIGDKNDKGTFILYATDWGIHHHLDSLNIFYSWNNNEWLSDLGYLWDQPEKHMTVRTPAHNLTVIDEQDQIKQGRGGNLHHYAILPKVKLIDASSNAYNQADIYRRAAILIEHTDKIHYIIDLFRVQGGKLQDYILHGPSHNYTLKNTNTEKYDMKMPYLLENPLFLKPVNDMSICWKGKEDDIFTIRIPDCAIENEKIILAEGWGQRGTTDVGTTLPYLMRRHEGESAYTFISLFGSSSGKSPVASFSKLGGNDDFYVLEVTLDSGSKDLIIYKFDAALSTIKTSIGDITFDGTLAVIKSFNNNESVVIYGGTTLFVNDKKWTTDRYTQTGKIVKFDDNGFYINLSIKDTDGWVGQTVYVEDTEKRTGYPVLKVTQEGSLVKITTWNDESEGFAFTGGHSWRFDNYTVFS